MANQVTLKTECLHVKKGGIELQIQRDGKTFGTMMNLPEGMPMYTRDLQQYLDYFGINKDKLLKNSQVNEHDALADARWNYRLYLAIKRLMGVEL